MKINNLPKYAENYSYIVVRRVDGELWFYGGYADVDKAISVADQIDGEVIPTKECTDACEVNV